MKKKEKESEEKKEIIVYLIRISEKEVKNSRIRKAVFDLIDTKIREIMAVKKSWVVVALLMFLSAESLAVNPQEKH